MREKRRILRISYRMSVIISLFQLICYSRHPRRHSRPLVMSKYDNL